MFCCLLHLTQLVCGLVYVHCGHFCDRGAAASVVSGSVCKAIGLYSADSHQLAGLKYSPDIECYTYYHLQCIPAAVWYSVSVPLTQCSGLSGDASTTSW